MCPYVDGLVMHSEERLSKLKLCNRVVGDGRPIALFDEVPFYDKHSFRFNTFKLSKGVD